MHSEASGDGPKGEDGSVEADDRVDQVPRSRLVALQATTKKDYVRRCEREGLEPDFDYWRSFRE